MKMGEVCKQLALCGYFVSAGSSEPQRRASVSSWCSIPGVVHSCCHCLMMMWEWGAYLVFEHSASLGC